MESLKCIIVDDERKDRENIQMLLDTYCPEVEVIGEAYDRASILELFRNTQPHLAFLDIQLEETTIFEILDELQQLDFLIVFVTAFDQFAITGYRYAAIDYILKPINYKRLVEVVGRARELSAKIDEDRGKELDRTSIKTISVSDNRGTHLINVSDILYCNSEGNYTTFEIKDSNNLVISKNLKYFENLLSQSGFLRIHKRHLINTTHIDSVVKGKTPAVIMKNGISLRISRLLKKEVFQQLQLS